MRVLAAVLLLLCAAANAAAQVARGAVRDAESGAPVTGVFVVLVDSLGVTRGGVLTDARGLYHLRAAQPGTYRLRAERIGHASTISNPVVLAAGATTTVDIPVAVAAIELAPLEVETDARCVTRQRTSARVAQLWEEARKALSVASWVQRQGAIEFESSSWVRNYRLPLMVVAAESLTHRVTRTLPYSAIPAGTLTRFGFVQKELGATVFYGPDAEVLLSDEFLQSHCFESVNGSGLNRGSVGLAFRPMPGLELPDIEGTLWLDARTLELQHIDFRYVNVAPEYRTRETGGRTEFRRLASGAWIVSNWYIRMPLSVVRDRAGQLVAQELRESGGVVTAIRQENRVESLARGGVVEGVVYDSVSGGPLSGALVYLSGTSYRAQSDAAGRYRIAGVPAGKYVIAFSHAVLDSMPLLPRPREVQVTTDETATQDLGTSSVIAQVAQRCGDQEGGLLFGHVRSATGTAADVEVRARFQRYRARAGGVAEYRTNSIGHADAGGQYVLCGLPLDTPLEVSVRRPDEPARSVEVRLTGRPYRRLDLQLRD